MTYNPGLHLIGDLKSNDASILIDVKSANAFIDDRIQFYNLQKLGDHYHSFGADSGFTAIVCLTESHISLHTWPEHGYLTLDIYLSNYLQVNEGKAKGFYNDCLVYFKIIDHTTTELKR